MPTFHPSTPGAVLFNGGGPIKIDNRCPVLVPMSKNITGPIHIEPIRGQDCPCKCEHPALGETINTYTLRYETELKFSPGDERCDKVKEAQMLDGCYMSIKGELKLRDSKCPPHTHAGGDPHQGLDLFIGCQTGDFIMYRPIDPADTSQGFVAVFMGSLFGTVGFDPTGADHPRCCFESWVRGMIIGRGVGGMEDCEICVTYDGSFQSLDDLDLCRENDIKWDLIPTALVVDRFGPLSGSD